MKLLIETENPFYEGWLAHFMGFPIETCDSQAAKVGWTTGHETADLTKESEHYRNIVHQANLGRLYMAFIAECECKHITVTLSPAAKE